MTPLAHQDKSKDENHKRPLHGSSPCVCSFEDQDYQNTANRVPKMLATLEPVLASLGTSYE